MSEIKNRIPENGTPPGMRWLFLQWLELKPKPVLKPHFKEKPNKRFLPDHREGSFL